MSLNKRIIKKDVIEHDKGFSKIILQITVRSLKFLTSFELIPDNAKFQSSYLFLLVHFKKIPL